MLGKEISPLFTGVDLLDGEFTASNVIAKAVPFDRDVLRARAVLGVLIGNLESTSIVLKDDGLVLFAEHVAIRGRTRAGKGGVGGARAKLGDFIELSAHRY